MKAVRVAVLSTIVMAAVGTTSAYPFFCKVITPGRLTSDSTEYDASGNCSGACNGTYYSCPSDDSCATSIFGGVSTQCCYYTASQACAIYTNGAVNLTTGCCENGIYSGPSQTVSVQKTIYWYCGEACKTIQPGGEG